jgi:aspartate/tyrosine/aromatic aminotransferase
LSKKYHIHLVSNGRMCLCGISDKNIDYLVDSFKKALEEEEQI